MRSLSEFEQRLVQRLLQASGTGVPNLPTVLDQRLNNTELYRLGPQTWEMRFDAQYFQAQTLVDAVRELARDLASAAHLLKELEANGLILLYDESPMPNPASFGQLVRGHHFIPAAIHDRRLNQLLDETAFSSILVNPGLVEYVNAGFRMPDEVRADNDLRMNRRNLRVAAWALVASVGIGLWQVCLAYREVHYGRLQVEQTQQVELDSAQYRGLSNRVESLEVLLRHPPSIRDTVVHSKHSCPAHRH